jgi:uncharacterized protein
VPRRFDRQEDEIVSYKSGKSALRAAAFVSLVALSSPGFAEGPKPCSVAVVSAQVSKSENVCDPKTVAALAGQGHVFEQNQMGLASMLVIGPDYDARGAAAWFQKAAQNGYAPAQVNLAVLYENGWGVPKNYGVALHWLEEAAHQHNPSAYYNLGELYFMGWGVHQDYREALRLFQLGANAGNTYAQTNLAYMYDRGIGVDRNLEAAARWYRKAADAGNPMAQSNLANMYRVGDGVPKDEKMAFHLYQQAAEKGHTGAQIQLAYRLALGVDSPKNPESALAWVTAAVLAGDNRGQELLKSLQLQLTPDQVKHAKQAAMSLRASSDATSKSLKLQP